MKRVVREVPEVRQCVDEEVVIVRVRIFLDVL